MKILRVACVLGGFLSLVLSVSAQTFTTVFSFDSADGQNPAAPLVQATNGNFYGTTSSDDGTVRATVFSLTPSGTLTTLYKFADGSDPLAGLVQGANGNFYGTAEAGGAYRQGSIFEITAAGVPTTLYSFCPQSGCADGANPAAGLVQANNGNFYGTTTVGGANGHGTVFEITAAGTLTTLYSFCSQGASNCTDGVDPVGTLVQATDGNFYGTTEYGGANAGGTVFKITASGTLTTLYSFCSQGGSNCTDGKFPHAGLVQGTNGNFYGTTYEGGNEGYGTVFKISAGGKLTTLYRFCSQGGCTDGGTPLAALVQATDSNFYGTASNGGAYGYGTVFNITPTGTLSTLYSFCSDGYLCSDGRNPGAALMQDTNGNFYGTTEWGGADNDCRAQHIIYSFPCGTVFSLSVGLGPFVTTQPTSGKMGAAVNILGTNLTGTTSVTFNGTAATFNVASDSEITATVPTGATTGKVEVTTPSGKLTSNVNFRVP